MESNNLLKYNRALSRRDISLWLTHLSKDHGDLSAFNNLKNMLYKGVINPSLRRSITKYESKGCTCFYDINPLFYEDLLNTNPNNRKPYGIIVSKDILWSLGGRPAIYLNSDEINNQWPTDQKFRLINTDLNRYPIPINWTHEKEWRKVGELQLFNKVLNQSFIWWWPLVKNVKDCQLLFREFHYLSDIYVLELNKVLTRNDLLF